MRMRRMTISGKRAQEARLAWVINRAIVGFQINIMDLSKVSAKGRELLDWAMKSGLDLPEDRAVEALRAYVETIAVKS